MCEVSTINKFSICFLFINFLVLFSFSNCFALDKITYDGNVHDYKVRDITLMLNNDKFEPKEGQMPPIILNDRTLVPVREVFEYLGGTVNWENSERRVDVSFDNRTISLWIDNTTAKVDGKEIKLDVPAKIINNKTMVPARFIAEKADLLVSWDQETYTVDIKFQKADITKLGFTTINGVNCLVINSNDKITGYKYSGYQDNDIFKLWIEIENCNFKFDTTNATFDSGMVSAIRFGNQGNGNNKIVLDLREETDYVVVMSQDRTKLYFAMSKDFIIPGEENASKPVTPTNTDKVDDSIINDEPTTDVPSNSGNDKPVENKPVQNSGEIEPISQGDNIILDGNNPDSIDDIVPFNEHDYETTDDEEIDYAVSIDSIKYSATTGRVKIKYTGEIKYDDMTLTNPNRVVIDIPDAKLNVSGPTEISIKNSIITGVRFSQYTESSVRIVLDLSAKGEYYIYKRTSELQINVIESTYKNIKYKKNTSNSQITLQDVNISTLSFDRNEDKFKYIIKYNKSKNDFGEGSLNPDDEFVNSVTVENGTITILDTGNCNYAVRQSNDNVVITIRKNVEEKPQNAIITNESGENIDKRIIMIDVGHGGSDPGACNGSAQEKEYNLNIALYLYDMLKEREDIEVYIDREDNNTYLNREDRVAFATNLNPDFIVSIHNNSLANKAYSGTMVLYYNNDTESEFGDITSEECAKIVLKELVNKLGTINRGAVKRSDLHILSKTPCPSILCEVCFISNDEELERLKTKSFQKNAATAIYNGIDKILNSY